MIIKITSRTSRIAIRGTTFISANAPPLPPTCIAIIHLARKRAGFVLTNPETNYPGEEDSHNPCLLGFVRQTLRPWAEKQNGREHGRRTRLSYWPASSLAVIRPTLSIPAERIM